VALLLESDYARLGECNLPYEEDSAQRFFVFMGVSLEKDLYTVVACDVLVVIPPNYPQAGNDMFWTFPRLRRTDGRQIPATRDPGGGDSRAYGGREFCRWSRHWNPSSPSGWRAGKDDIMTIYRRVLWALQNPEGQ
jgi:hypothetical protein